MKHNDYMIIGSCKKCGKPIMTPVFWEGKLKAGGYAHKPKVVTCSHKEQEHAWG